MSFELYLEHNEIDITQLPQVVNVEIFRDYDKEMAYITINGVTVHGGNFSDFYNGCEDHPDIGEFNDIDELAEVIEISLNELGHVVEFEVSEYEYDD